MNGLHVSNNYTLINENLPFVKLGKYYIDTFPYTLTRLLIKVDNIHIIKFI
jgi:hypothetical protein